MAGYHFPRGGFSVESNNISKSLTPPPQGAPWTLLSCEVIETHWVFSNCETQLSHLLNEWVGQQTLLLFFPDPKGHSSAQNTQLPPSFKKKTFEHSVPKEMTFSNKTLYSWLNIVFPSASCG